MFRLKNNKNKKDYVYLITYSYNQEIFLSEFLTYYLEIIKVDEIIVVEDFENKEKFNENSLYKYICKFFGDKVRYSYHIRVKEGHANNQRIVVRNWIRNLRKECKNNVQWLLYLDIDEFLDLKGLTMPLFLNKFSNLHQNKAGFGFMQQLFGHNNVEQHNIGDLVIDTHRKSIKFDIGKEKWRSKSWDNFAKSNRVENYSSAYPIGFHEVCEKGFKAMYKLDFVDMGWVHPSEFQKKIHTFQQDYANINHYWIVTIGDIYNHYSKDRILCREYTSKDLEEDSKEYSNLYQYTEIIKNDERYKQSINFLKKIIDNNSI